ncbi:hypothetical protein LT493_02620 [Streptomyces tricolor]|nr:hypothetical protein [Streptomyces tricolor]
MSDELDLLRRANPVPADGPHFGDGPLDHRAERRLERLLAPGPAGAPRAPRPVAVGPGRRRCRRGDRARRAARRAQQPASPSPRPGR